MGSPQHASADKGEHLFAQFAQGASEFLSTVAAWDGSGNWGA
jgi:hypothetical protein